MEFKFDEWLNLGRPRHEMHTENGLKKRVSLSNEVGRIFKEIRKLLLHWYGQDSWCGNIRFHLRILGEDARGIKILQQKKNANSLVEGVKRDLYSIRTMIEEVQGASDCLNGYYTDLDGIENWDELKERVFWIFSHPIFFDVEESFRFVMKTYEAYNKNVQDFCSLFPLAIPIIWKPQVDFSNLKDIIDPQQHQFEGPSAHIIKYMRDILNHFQDRAGSNIRLDLKKILKLWLFRTSDLTLLPKIHLGLRNGWIASRVNIENLYGKPFPHYLASPPLGLEYLP